MSDINESRMWLEHVNRVTPFIFALTVLLVIREPTWQAIVWGCVSACMMLTAFILTKVAGVHTPLRYYLMPTEHKLAIVLVGLAVSGIAVIVIFENF